MSNLTEEQRLQRACLAVITHIKYRSLGGVVMMGAVTLEEDPDKCPTAYTDGFNVVYGYDFVASLTDPQLRFLILHENLHKALLHLTTWQWMWKEDPDLANQACDFVINLLLMASDDGEGFIAMPPDGALDQQYKDMDAGEVYRLLKKNGGGGRYKGFDQHGWREATTAHPKGGAGVKEEVGKALQQGKVVIGNQAGSLDRAVQDVMEPKIDWATQLREFVSSMCAGKDFTSWRRPRRRTIDSGIYLPSHYSETVGRVGVGVDTSGSIDGAALTRFLSEVCGIAQALRPELIDLLYWDTRVAGHEKYGDGQYEMLRESTKPKGGGGTSPSCVTRYIAEKNLRFECFVVLSDGEVGSDWGGAWPCPVLWCVTNRRRIATVGRTLYIGD